MYVILAEGESPTTARPVVIVDDEDVLGVVRVALGTRLRDCPAPRPTTPKRTGAGR